MSNIFEDTRFIMKKYGIKADKSLGQNFLVDENVVESIVSGAKITKNDLVIEIGPGLGTLTKYLLNEAGKVICIELDKRMIEILNDRFSLYDNFELINDDVLKVDLNQLILNEKSSKNIINVKIVANLPYYITTPIVMKLLESNLDIESITIMIQKEVAERLTANPGENKAGAITYSVYYYCTSEKILEVPNTSFIPEPEVTSEVIKLNLRKESIVDVEDTKKLFSIIKNAFTQRRKTLLNVLTNTKVFENKEKGKQILEELNLDVNVRPENLTLQDYAKLSHKVK